MKKYAAIAALALVSALGTTGTAAAAEDQQPVPGACVPSETVACPPPPPSPVMTAGDRPADRYFFQHKRSCKVEAKKWTRVVTVTHELGTSANGASWWQQETRVGKWYRVYPPRGCVLRHQEWKRNHRGQVDGKAVRR